MLASRCRRSISGSSSAGSFQIRRPAARASRTRIVGRARLIQDLKTDLGVNDEGVDVILHLLDQLHGLRRALDQLHKDL